MAILKKILFVAVILVLLTIAIYPEGFRYLADVATNPWAHSLRGEPTLTGRWLGQVKFEGRSSREMFLEIRREPLVSHRRLTRGKYGRGGTFTGTASMPDESGTLIHYEIIGNSNRSGSKVLINFRDTNRQPSSNKQPLMQQLRGSWEGTTLKLVGEYTTLVYDGKSSTYDAGETPMPVTTTMTRQLPR